MKTVLVAPFARPLRNGKNNPKNFPWWKEVVSLLKTRGVYVVQVSVKGEPDIGANERRDDLKIGDMTELTNKSDTWATVDSFFQHFCNAYKLKKGIVVFGPSDPNLFGYRHNTNVLKDRSVLRPDQWNIWEALEFDEKRFPSAEEVTDIVLRELGEKVVERPRVEQRVVRDTSGGYRGPT